MKRLILSLWAVLATLASFAQEAGPLDAFAANLSAGEIGFKYDFEVKGDLPLKGAGKAVLSGDAYHVAGNGMEIWCDGVTRWIVDRTAQEAYIEAVEAEAADYLSNPAALLRALSSAFEVNSVSDVTLSGRKLRAVRMTPAVEDTGLREVVLYLDGAAPARVSIKVEDGTETLFRISGFTVKEKSDAAFSFDIASLGSDYLVTDLR